MESKICKIHWKIFIFICNLICLSSYFFPFSKKCFYPFLFVCTNSILFSQVLNETTIIFSRACENVVWRRWEQIVFRFFFKNWSAIVAECNQINVILFSTLDHYYFPLFYKAEKKALNPKKNQKDLKVCRNDIFLQSWKK